MLYPPMDRCINPLCRQQSFLRHKDDPRTIVLFGLAQGCQDALSVHLYCHCQYSLFSDFKLNIKFSCHDKVVTQTTITISPCTLVFVPITVYFLSMSMLESISLFKGGFSSSSLRKRFFLGRHPPTLLAFMQYAGKAQGDCPAAYPEWIAAQADGHPEIEVEAAREAPTSGEIGAVTRE